MFYARSRELYEFDPGALFDGVVDPQANTGPRKRSVPATTAENFSEETDSLSLRSGIVSSLFLDPRFTLGRGAWTDFRGLSSS